ncbi:MAG: GntR family transcriptional regulator [Lachnospiraceae bacterium]|nr:GntR family transcriptional regulator [Lachnospiraceae bacterium]
MQDLNEMDDAFLPLRDVVFKKLRAEILLGKLKPGERLMEIHLAQRLGVSRTPIREAIRKLELEGLVTMIPRRGAEVAQISEKNLKDVLEVRLALETLAVRLACQRMDQQALGELRQACDHFAKVTANKDMAEITRADVALHDVIIRSTGNRKLEQMISNLSEQMYRYRFEYIKETSYHTLLIEEHERIYESIAKRDPDMAEKEITNHIENQLQTIMEHLNFPTQQD